MRQIQELWSAAAVLGLVTCVAKVDPQSHAVVAFQVAVPVLMIVIAYCCGCPTDHAVGTSAAKAETNEPAT